MDSVKQKAAAKKFAATWAGKGDEKQDTQSFWNALLRDVFGVERPEEHIQYEMPVKLDHTSFIDGYIKTTAVLIEQKGVDVSLKKTYKQSDGKSLTPFEQARRYAGSLPHNENPRWIVVSNFQTFEIHDMNFPNDPPETIQLSELGQEAYRLNFLVSEKEEHIKKEMSISLKAGDLVGVLYDSLLKQYKDPNSPETLKSLNALCVRLVFCLYAEDAGVFGRHGMFHDYLRDHRAEDRRALLNLFRVLNQPIESRDPYLDEDLAAFPYVNGGLFADESLIIPRLGDDVIDIILQQASEEFDWSAISPTIFGAVFESTLNPETRHKGGMHYTSIENIHKAIDPLFLDELKGEWEQAKNKPIAAGVRTKNIAAFHEKLASLRFLDPACGSGNFLTETYLSLRRLENEIIRELYTGVEGQFALGEMAGDVFDSLKIKVSISQFYGIEINDFAVTVAKTALWIAESQMIQETEKIVHMHLDFLPLKSYANIVEGNALQLDWEGVVPKKQLHYIVGNPPFLGARRMEDCQKADLEHVFAGWKNIGDLDYVSGWYKKAADMMKGTAIRTALVSTNSITQGEAVAILWKPLFSEGVHIDFAHRTFRWDSEAKIKAKVHCVIIGFSIARSTRERLLYSSDRPQPVRNINGYLLDADNIFVESRSHPICAAPEIGIGNKPIDGGNYLFSKEEKDAFIKKEPSAEKWFKPWYGADEFINARPRYCLWLGDCPPSELRKMPECMKRVESVRTFRLSSKSAGTRRLSEKPTRFHVENMPQSTYLLVPRVSSEKRRYVPIGFMTPDMLVSDSVHIIPNAGLYHFGILTSNIHMAWMRAVCGRLEMRYRYSKEVVYNNYPWPTPTSAQRALIEQTAQGILDARKEALEKDPAATLADLYDENTMPDSLRAAHRKNNRAVWDAYGRAWDISSETECVVALMKLYQDIAK